ncbi:ATP-binding protein [Parachryseolinea silvisoli]|uniref:ATP-binding protein n=1 Tax=Parachryseolinea silvisoli TaxID=2873601 RepID=UPI002265A92C|nr:ATP-binding protein [Parachryseolinea silvisoli]MCD9019078.1 ATP-binding protein [Parachryseolinea silvisoli]
MDNPPHFTSYSVEDRSHVAIVKREIHSRVVQAGFSKTRVGEVDIVVSEVTSNLIKYAGSGELLYRIVLFGADNPALEVLCIDNGPGMTDPARMVRDGVSTRDTLGQGLGAMQRLSDIFELYSLKGWGTIVYTQLKATKCEPAAKASIRIRSLNVPKPGETVSGDGHLVKHEKNGVRIFVADGLGHGEAAHEAAKAGLQAFQSTRTESPVEMLRYVHEQVRKTRGMVGTIASYNKTENEWTFCGIGNISNRTYTGLEFKNYMSYNGIIGLNIPGTMKDARIPGEKNQHLILCSDGIRTRWDITKYPSVFKHDTIILAACLYKDFSRRNDDASILIATINPSR